MGDTGGVHDGRLPCIPPPESPHPILTVPPPLSPLVIRPPRSGGIPAMLKVAPPILLREAARKGEPVKLVELIEHGADPNYTDEVREGS